MLVIKENIQGVSVEHYMTEDYNLTCNQQTGENDTNLPRKKV